VHVPWRNCITARDMGWMESLPFWGPTALVSAWRFVSHFPLPYLLQDSSRGGKGKEQMTFLACTFAAPRHWFVIGPCCLHMTICSHGYRLGILYLIADGTLETRGNILTPTKFQWGLGNKGYGGVVQQTGERKMALNPRMVPPLGIEERRKVLEPSG
jgi:hypothetical protein